ncbi:hypothetical protein MMPV_005166 [Pyropia vietnamensis]
MRAAVAGVAARRLGHPATTAAPSLGGDRSYVQANSDEDVRPASVLQPRPSDGEALGDGEEAPPVAAPVMRSLVSAWLEDVAASGGVRRRPPWAWLFGWLPWFRRQPSSSSSSSSGLLLSPSSPSTLSEAAEPSPAAAHPSQLLRSLFFAAAVGGGGDAATTAQRLPFLVTQDNSHATAVLAVLRRALPSGRDDAGKQSGGLWQGLLALVLSFNPLR